MTREHVNNPLCVKRDRDIQLHFTNLLQKRDLSPLTCELRIQTRKPKRKIALLTRLSINWAFLAFTSVMASKDNLKPAPSSGTSVFVPRELGLSLFSTIFMDCVLTWRGSWPTIIPDNRAVPTSSMSLLVAWMINLLLKIKHEFWMIMKYNVNAPGWLAADQD